MYVGQSSVPSSKGSILPIEAIVVLNPLSPLLNIQELLCEITEEELTP
jgi:hypothetical protein